MKKILIINPFGVGDVLFTTPVISALKKKFPDSFIGYLCHKQMAPILVNHPFIDKLFLYTRGDLKQVRKKSYLDYLKMLIKAITEIRHEKFDIAVDLSMVSQYSFLLKLLGVKQRFGFDYKNRGIFLSHKINVDTVDGKHIIEYYRDLLKELEAGCFCSQMEFYNSQDDKQFAEDFLLNNNLNDADILIGIAPFGGASWGKDAIIKQWSHQKFAEVIKKLLNNYNCKIIIFGTKENADNCMMFSDLLDNKRVINAMGKTTLGQLAALINKCSLFISNDSGPMHIACAKDVDTVSIFGPVDESIYGPLGKKAKHEVVKADINCRPCYKNFKKPDCKNIDCLDLISEEMVMSAVERVLGKKIRRSN